MIFDLPEVVELKDNFPTGSNNRKETLLFLRLLKEKFTYNKHNLMKKTVYLRQSPSAQLEAMIL